MEHFICPYAYSILAQINGKGMMRHVAVVVILTFSDLKMLESKHIKIQNDSVFITGLDTGFTFKIMLLNPESL